MATKIISAEFVKGIIGTDDILTDGRRQIAFIGRSNVGKSSVINSLAGKKYLAKSSSVPGKTQQINFFLVNKKFYFVDLPGYGFAKIPEQKREKLRKMILWYFADSQARPEKVVLVVDAKVGATEFDRQMIAFLKEHRYDIFVIANKADKLKQSERAKKLHLIRETLGHQDVLLYSAKMKEGRAEFLIAIGGMFA